MSSFSSCPPPPRVVLFCVLLLFPISRTFPRAFVLSFSLSLSLSLSLRETQKTAPPSRDRYERRRYEVVDRLRARSLSLSASKKVATKRVNLKPLLFSPFQTSGKRSKTPRSLFCTARITRKTFAHRKRIRERDDDATRREEASPRIHRPDAFLFFFFIFHPRRGRIFAL